jgi:hypothetical protein
MEYIKRVFNKNKFSFSFEKNFNPYANEVVLGIDIGRHALPKALSFIANNITIGTHYDKLFHLYLVFHTKKGDILIEKTQQVDASLKIPKDQVETYTISNFPKMPLKQYITNCRKQMGDNLFFYIQPVPIIAKYLLKICYKPTVFIKVWIL